VTSWRELPPPLAPLRALALDIRWTWSHEGVALWSRIDAEVSRRTRNPWSILAGVSSARLNELAEDPVCRLSAR
jgi:starch phosphorylase